jgi:hypothetical protein
MSNNSDESMQELVNEAKRKLKAGGKFWVDGTQTFAFYLTVTSEAQAEEMIETLHDNLRGASMDFVTRDNPTIQSLQTEATYDTDTHTVKSRWSTHFD